MKIFLYVRPETIDYFKVLSLKAFENPDITVASDFKNCGDIWLGESLYKTKTSETLLNDELYYDIKSRCRFLRRLDNRSAKELIDKYWIGVESIFKENRFDFVMAQIIDNYCMDIIDRVAKKYNVPVISFSPTFISGYSRFTIRGELIKLTREIGVSEVTSVLGKLLAPKYKARYAGMNNKSELKAYKWYFRRFLIERLYYPLRKLTDIDKFNYHYNTIYLSRGNVFDYVGPRINKYYNKISIINDYKNTIYMPLHVAPEASTDYWGDSPKFGYYEDVVLDFIRNTDSNIRIIVKEHPAVYGKRYIDFYKELSTFDNVLLIDPFEDSNDLLEKISNVVVCAGSVGIEAILRNKKVFTLTDNYYSSLHPNIHKVDYLKSADLDIEIEKYDNESFMNDLLQGLFEANICAEREISKSDLNEIARNIKNYSNQLTINSLEKSIESEAIL